MHILRTIHCFHPAINGPANQARHVSRILLSRGITSHIFTTKNSAPGALDREVIDGFAVTRFRESYGFMAYRRTIGAERLWNESADVLHAHNYRNSLTSIVARIARARDIPYVLQPHGGLQMFRHLFRGAFRWPYLAFDSLRKQREVLFADAVIVATEQEREEAIRFGVCEQRVWVIPVGFEVPANVHRSPAGSQDVLRLLFVGRISPNRQLEQVLLAIAELRKLSDATVTLRIVGPAAATSQLQDGRSYLYSLQRLATQLEIGNQVTFVGARYGDELDTEYRNADAFVYTSDYENFGQTILEAAGNGCPVVATPTGVARDLVSNGETGFLVPHRDHQQLARHLHALVQDRPLLARMSAAIRQRVIQRYQWSQVAEQYQAMYRALLGQ